MSEFNTTPFEDNEMEEGFEGGIENDREFKAYIYQQLVDLQPYLTSDSQVAVMVQQDPEQEDEDELTLTLVATWGEYRLEAEGTDTDLYSAFSIAKRKMIEQLDEWFNMAVDTSERDAQIQGYLDGSAMIH